MAAHQQAKVAGSIVFEKVLPDTHCNAQLINNDEGLAQHLQVATESTE